MLLDAGVITGTLMRYSVQDWDALHKAMQKNKNFSYSTHLALLAGMRAYLEKPTNET